MDQRFRIIAVSPAGRHAITVGVVLIEGSVKVIAIFATDAVWRNRPVTLQVCGPVVRLSTAVLVDLIAALFESAGVHRAIAILTISWLAAI